MKQYNRAVHIVAVFITMTVVSCGMTPRNHGDPSDTIKTLLYEQERAADALALATKALESHPLDAMLLYHRGMAHLALKKNDNALDDFAAALKIAPDNPMVYNGLGNVFYIRYEDAAAGRYWSRGLALSRDPATRAIFLGNMSLLATSGKKYDVADKLLKEAMSLSKDGRYHNLLGRLYLARKDRAKAGETWRKALTDASVTWPQASFKHNTLYRLAELLASARDFKEAAEFCGAAMDMSPATEEYRKLYAKLARYAK